jgi:hypothetical protein
LNSARGVLYISPSAKNATYKQIIESLRIHNENG